MTYSMSFTTATLLHNESVMVAQKWQQYNDWSQLRQHVVSNNLLQMRTHNTNIRIWREIQSRLKLLTPKALFLLADGTHQEQAHLLWLAVCKRYQFIYEFAVEVVHEKFLSLDPHLTYHHYDVFFANKAEWHPEVERVADSTRTKQRQVVFKMLREANLLTADNHILPALLSPRLIDTIAQDNRRHFAIYPVYAHHINEWISP